MHDKPMPAKAVRVSVPASVAYDIGSLKTSVAGILDKLGCRACCSGYDIFLEMQRDGVFRKGLRQGAMAGIGLSRASDTLTIGVSADSVARIEDLNDLIEKIGGLGGHPACMSGRDWRFTLEEMFVIQPETLEIEQVAARVAL
jgi:hypothetical protein